MTRIQDWINSPPEWGDWGQRANHWFNELATQYRTLYWESADGDRTFEVTDDDTNSIVEFQLTGAAGYIWAYDSSRVSYVDDTEYIWYEDDGTTAILTLDRDATTKTAIFNKTIEAEIYEADGGSVSSPAFTFNGDSDGGMYRPAANEVGIAANGSARVLIEGTHTRIRGGNNSGSGAGGRVYLETLNGTDIVSFDWNASAHSRMIVPAGRFDVVEEGGGTLDFRFAALGTTANAANAYVTSASGQLNRSTSLRRYKWSIEPYGDGDPDIMKLPARRFKWQPDVAGYRDREWSYGFIVEEAYEVSDGFVNLEKNEDGEVEATDLDLRAIVAALTAKVQEHERRLDNVPGSRDRIPPR